MKHKLVLFLLLFVCCQMIAKPVNERLAVKVASHFYKSVTNNTTQFNLVYEQPISIKKEGIFVDVTAFYIISSNRHDGFVVVSGDDRAHPIIGYASNAVFDKSNLPINAKKWFDIYQQEINYIISNNIPASKEIAKLWQDLTDNDYIHGNLSRGGFSPLLSTTWDQGGYYASQCPPGTVTGCVATAMAQVMKYWNYPQQGVGFYSYNHPYFGTLSANFAGTTYDWNAMPSTVFSPNNAVAELMYHCGVSVDMSYGSSSFAAVVAPSGVRSTEYALKNNFGYSNNLTADFRANYSNTAWINLLKSEINANRPIIHAGAGGQGQSGHAFVCDGYDNADYFHMNWGWGGMMDGYFWHNQLNPSVPGIGGGNGGYNYNQVIIKDVQPPNGSGSNNSSVIQLASSISINPSPIITGLGLSVSANVKNISNTSFVGEISAKLLDQNLNLIQTIDTYNEISGLPSNGQYNAPLSFVSNNITAAPGSYYLGIFVKSSSNDWQQASNGQYANMIPITVTYQNSDDIRMYSDIVITPAVLTQNESANFNFNIGNFGSNTFQGNVSIDLHNLDGTWIQGIDAYQNVSLCNGCHFTGGIPFSTTGLTVQPGTYLLAGWTNDGSGWELVEATSNFPNPVQVTIIAPPIQPDIYENNNASSSAHLFNLSFSNNTAQIMTNGANLHSENDIDFYKIDLPSGYEYTFTARVHDNYNSADGNSYTTDVLWSYDDGAGWSTPYDDINPNGDFTVVGGNSIYFAVAPYFAGQKGTYNFEVNITRSSSSDVTSSYDGVVKVFPNPFQDYLIIKNGEGIATIHNILGQVVKQFSIRANNTRVNTADLAKGAYTVTIEGSDGNYKSFKLLK